MQVRRLRARFLRVAAIMGVLMAAGTAMAAAPVAASAASLAIASAAAPAAPDAAMATEHVNIFASTNARGYCLDL